VKRLTYLSIAEEELSDAAAYYDQQEPGLGQAFANAVQAVTSRLQQEPDRWPFFENPIRSCRVWPFPYRLLYRDLPDRIQIVAVFHLSRRPGSWKARLR
jgi:plasmid stabilization system protein ParE